MKKLNGEERIIRTLKKQTTDRVPTFEWYIDKKVMNKNCLDIGKPGGGYILSSSNSIHSAVKPENYRSMLETLKKFGAYS